MQNSIHQNLSQCTFNFDALADQPYESPKLHLVQASPQKRCSKCGETKDSDQFHRHPATKDGLQPSCKQCCRVRSLELSLERDNARELGLLEVPSQKRCTKCGQIKDIDQFDKWKRSKDGHRAQCKQCRSATYKESSDSFEDALSLEIIDLPTHKQCLRCNKVKDLAQFGKKRVSRDGHHYYCRDCVNSLAREHNSKKRQARDLEFLNSLSPEELELRAEELELRKTHKQCKKCKEWLPFSDFRAQPKNSDGLCGNCRLCSRKYDHDNYVPSVQRNRQRRYKYGVSAEQYDQMLEAQGGVCAICHLPETRCDRLGNLKPLGIDHNHETDQVRGLLCHDCNVAYGFLREDPEIILSMLAYHEKYSQM